MITTIQTYKDIDSTAWSRFVQSSPTGTWFQMPEAYSFFADLPNVFRPFVVAVVEKGNGEKDLLLRAVCVGYITVEQNPIKQFFTRRAIIIGGPALAADCTSEEVALLMETVKGRINELGGAIYIETRNFNDYSRYRDGFEKAGFAYEEHNNFHINTETFGAIRDKNDDEEHEIVYEKVTNGLMGKNRIRDIKTSFRDGAVVIDYPTIEQVHDYYSILKNLYLTKVKTPLFPLAFFDALYHHSDGRFILVGLPKENDGIEIIGGTVCVALKDKCLYEWFVAGRDGEWKSIFPSSVATYAGIRYAAENNMPRFDMMGAGKPGDAYGVRDFKARFGGDLVEHGRYKCVCKSLLFKIGVFGIRVLKKKK